jgi:tetratricopeptide (TPR) repeat protein
MAALLPALMLSLPFLVLPHPGGSVHRPPARAASAHAEAPLPSDGLALSHEDPDTEVDHLALAEALSAQPAEALEELQKALFDDPLDEETLAQLQLRLGHAEDALESASAALQRNTQSAQAYLLRGRALLAQSKLDAAAEAFSAATQLDAGWARAFNFLGYTYLQQEDYARAQKALWAAVTLDPHSAAFQNNLGLAEQGLGHGAEAQAAFQRALDLSPRHVAAQANLKKLTEVALSARREGRRP